MVEYPSHDLQQLGFVDLVIDDLLAQCAQEKYGMYNVYCQMCIVAIFEHFAQKLFDRSSRTATVRPSNSSLTASLFHQTSPQIVHLICSQMPPKKKNVNADVRSILPLTKSGVI